jgi:predicted DNA-binding transcriptional regulator YafY
MERVFSINQMLRRHRPPTKAELLRRLAVSPATLKRHLDFMRDRLGEPIVWDRTRRLSLRRIPERSDGLSDPRSLVFT